MYSHLFTPRNLGIVLNGLLFILLMLELCKFVSRRIQRTSSKPDEYFHHSPTVAREFSFWGQIGISLMRDLLIGTVAAMYGINLVVGVLAFLMWFTYPGHHPKHLLAAPQNVLAEAKRRIVEQRSSSEEHDEQKPDTARPISGISQATSDAFWGGKPDPAPTDETRDSEYQAFDTMPPKQKCAVFDTAMPVDLENVPERTATTYAPTQWYRVRIGRSTFFFTTLAQLNMYKGLWAADHVHARAASPEDRSHFTGLKVPPKPCDRVKCLRAFTSLSAAERFICINAATKLKCPVPAHVPLSKDCSREAEYFELRLCCGQSVALPADIFVDLKIKAFEAMQAENSVASRVPPVLPAQLVRTTSDQPAKNAVQVIELARIIRTF